jgi:hypothetical protein
MRTAAYLGGLLVAGALACAPAGDDPRGTDAGAVGDAGAPLAVADADAGSLPTDAGFSPADGGSLLADGGASASSPALVGEHEVVALDLAAGESDEIPVRVYLPDVAPVAIALFLPGFRLQSAWYAPLLEHLASHGIAVVAADPPASLLSVDHVRMAADARLALDAALDVGAPLAGATAPVFAMGHSLGGKLGFMVAAADARVAGVFAIDPVNGGGPLGYSETRPDVVPGSVAGLAMPLGIVGETTDAVSTSTFGQACAPSDQSFSTFYEAASSATVAYEWEVMGAGHMDFVDDTSSCGLTCGVCNDSTADPVTTRATVRALAVAFFRRHGGGNLALDAWLVGESVPSGVAVRSRP